MLRQATGARVLHVLPHPGGGGETYVDYLSTMEGYTFERLYLGPEPRPKPSVLAGALLAQMRSYRFDLVHAHGEVAAALCLPTLALRPSAVTIHGLHLVRRLGGSMRRPAEANLRLIVRAASATICVGDSELADVRSIVGDAGRLVLVHNGVAPAIPPSADERAAARTELGLQPEDLVGLYLGGLDPHKEPLVAVEAARRVVEVGLPFVLLVAGDGPLRATLDAISGQGIRVLGFQRDLRRLFAAADIFVLPSRREGLSFALLEAMAAGLATIVSDAPGNRDAVDAAGTVVPAGDVAAFSAAFKALAADGTKLRELSRNARARAALFSSREMVDRTRDVYERVLGTVP